MMRTTVHLTAEAHGRLLAMARDSGRARSELIRRAIDDFLARRATASRRNRLRRARGIWKDHGRSEFQVIRQEVETRLNNE